MSAVADDRELVPEAGVHVLPVAPVLRQPDPERGEELVVGDVLLLRPDDPARDLELQLLGKDARKARHDPVVLQRKQRVGGRERDVLVRAHIAGDEGLRGASGRLEPAHQCHRRGGRGVAACVPARQVAAIQQQLRSVVGEPSVDRPLAQPLQPRLTSAVDAEAVDVARDRVDLLPCRPPPAGTRCGGSAQERNRADCVGEILQPVGGTEGDRRVLASRLLTQAERVIHELSPDEAPLSDAVLREQVLIRVAEHTVADVPLWRAGDRPCDPVGVIRLGNPDVLRVRLSPLRMAAIVAAAVQCSDLWWHVGARERDEQQKSGERENELAHDDLLHRKEPQAMFVVAPDCRVLLHRCPSLDSIVPR